MSDILDEDLSWFIDKIFYVINYKKNNIKNIEDLRKYIYINDFKEDEFKIIKELFNKYGEKKILDCIMKLKNKNININNKNKVKECINKK